MVIKGIAVRSERLLHRLGGCFILASAVVGLLLATVTSGSGQNPSLPQRAEVATPPPAVTEKAVPVVPPPKGTKRLDRETVSDSTELCTLADQLRDELSKMNVNVLSLDVIRKTHAIEELARKIKTEAHAGER